MSGATDRSGRPRPDRPDRGDDADRDGTAGSSPSASTGGRSKRRVVFVSEIPVGYRHGLFSHIHDNTSLDARVLYLAEAQSDRPWESPVEPAAWWRVLQSRSLTANRAGFFARMTPSIGRELAGEQPDLVLLPGWAHPSSWQAALWCRRNDVPYGVMFENWRTQSGTRVPDGVVRGIRSAILGGATVALPVGERAARFAAATTDAVVRTFHANVADVERARTATAGVDRDVGHRVLFLGRLMPHKGIEIVLDMAPSLAASGIAVEVVGDGPCRPLVESAARSGLLTFHGPVEGDAKFALMARASVVVVPSRSEPWGVVVQEALASGTPVLASPEVGCTPEFIEAGRTGAVVAANRGSFESAVRSWVDNAASDRDTCASKASSVTYASVAAELEAVVAEVLS